MKFKIQNSKFKIIDRWALVTGAGSGIGSCYVRQLAALGYNLVLAGRNPESLKTIAEEVRMGGSEVREITIDLAREGAAAELYALTKAESINIDVLINNAGIFSFCDITETPAERIGRTVFLHIMTGTQLCRLYAKDMIVRGAKGYILNMSSYSLWMPFPGLALYSASKAYVRAFSIAFSKEVAEHNIRVTAICPAGVATDFFGLSPRWKGIAKRLGVLITPEKCARKGLKAMWRGRRCVVPDWWNRAWIPFLVILPMWILRPVRKFTMKFQQ